MASFTQRAPCTCTSVATEILSRKRREYVRTHSPAMQNLPPQIIVQVQLHNLTRQITQQCMLLARGPLPQQFPSFLKIGRHVDQQASSSRSCYPYQDRFGFLNVLVNLNTIGSYQPVRNLWDRFHTALQPQIPKHLSQYEQESAIQVTSGFFAEEKTYFP